MTDFQEKNILIVWVLTGTFIYLLFNELRTFEIENVVVPEVINNQLHYFTQ